MRQVRVALSLPVLLFLVLVAKFTNFISSTTNNNNLVDLPTCLFTNLPIRCACNAGGFDTTYNAAFTATRFFRGKTVGVQINLLTTINDFINDTLNSRVILLLDSRILHAVVLVVLPITTILVL